jgi:hypothetical protein
MQDFISNENVLCPRHLRSPFKLKFFCLIICYKSFGFLMEGRVTKYKFMDMRDVIGEK